jgi:hypothetical protein
METKRPPTRTAPERAAHFTLDYYTATQRLDAAALRWFVFLWTWSAPRFTGAAGHRHDWALARLGVERYRRRVQRVRALGARLRERSR